MPASAVLFMSNRNENGTVAQCAATMAGNLRHDDRGAAAVDSTRIPLRIDLSATWSVDMKACASVLFVPAGYRSMPPRAQPVSFRVSPAPGSCNRTPCSPWQQPRCTRTAMHPAWTALLLGRICPICFLVTPCHAGASPFSVRHGVSPRTAWNSTRACSRRKREPDSSPRCERCIRGGDKDRRVEYVRTSHSARRAARVRIPPPGDGNVFPPLRTTKGNHGI